MQKQIAVCRKGLKDKRDISRADFRDIGKGGCERTKSSSTAPLQFMSSKTMKEKRV